MDEKRWAWLVWGICGLLIPFMVWQDLAALGPKKAIGLMEVLNDLTFLLFLIISTLVGTLILARQRRNTIGWLLLAYPLALAIASPLDGYVRQSANLQPMSLGLWLAFWLSSWSWWLLMGPVLLIPLLFPTGRFLTPRWRWVAAGLGGLFVYFLALAAFARVLSLESPVMEIPNPIGFLDDSSANLLIVPFELGLLAAASLCVAAVFVRYRRANALEREQIKWLAYACGIFLAFYSLGFLPQQWSGVLTGILFNLAISLIPLAIGAAILRYHLWDIDVIIRRTLAYSLLTLTLALIYFGSVILLQRALGRLVGQDSQVVILLSTLLSAALFSPLRGRIQGGIDRQFNRRKYDAERVLAEYASTARNETDLGRLTSELSRTVQETVQPESVSIWLSH